MSNLNRQQKKTLGWCRQQTVNYPRVKLVDFGESWKDGFAINALLHSLRPEFINYDELVPENRFENINGAIDVFEQAYNMKTRLSVEAVIQGNSDKIYRFVRELYFIVHPEEKDEEPPQAASREETSSNEDLDDFTLALHLRMFLEDLQDPQADLELMANLLRDDRPNPNPEVPLPANLEQEEVPQNPPAPRDEISNLKLWCQQLASDADVQITDFGESWTDGKALNAVLHRLIPDFITNDMITPESMYENIGYILDIAHQMLDVPEKASLDVSDLLEGNEDKILSFLRHLYLQNGGPEAIEELKNDDNLNVNTDREDGTDSENESENDLIQLEDDASDLSADDGQNEFAERVRELEDEPHEELEPEVVRLPYLEELAARLQEQVIELPELSVEEQVEEEAPEVEFTCETCFEEYRSRNSAVCSKFYPDKGNENDVHRICSVCLQRQVKQLTIEGSLAAHGVGLLCVEPVCGNIMPWPHVSKLIESNEDRELLKRRLDQEALSCIAGTTEKCTYCPFEAEIEDSVDEQQYFDCLWCAAKFCRRCKVDWKNHKNLTCEEAGGGSPESRARREVEEQLSRAIMRTCHKCGLNFAIEEGCNKMTCRCTATQCYTCGAKDIEYAHFCSHARMNGQCEIACGRKCVLNDENNTAEADSLNATLSSMQNNPEQRRLLQQYEAI